MTPETTNYFDYINKFRDNSKVWTEITGPRTILEAVDAANAKADAVGLLVGEFSPGYIDTATAASIHQNLPKSCQAILVTHVIENSELAKLIKETGIMVIGLFGDNTPDDLQELKETFPNLTIIKAIGVQDEETALKEMRKYSRIAHAIAFDTKHAKRKRIGGTGHTHNWEYSRILAQECPVPGVLAGGLNSGNVQAAIRIVKPYGVDVSSATRNSDDTQNSQEIELFVYKAYR